MNPVFSEWLRELRNEPLSLGPNPGDGGQKNLWTVARSAASQLDADLEAWVAFLDSAVEVRRAQHAAATDATFYAWHDEQANQLRFSAATGGPIDLPFGAKVRLVEDPRTVIQAWLDREGDVIPWGELVEADPVETGFDEELERTNRIRVCTWPLAGCGTAQRGDPR